VKVLVDTNILVRIAQTGHPHSQIAAKSLDGLQRRQAELCLCAQNLCESWAVATRPIASNGLGLNTQDAAVRLDWLCKAFELLFETDQAFQVWRQLVSTHRVSGKSAHDARIASIMVASSVLHILTSNVSDFSRFPKITPIDPATVSSPIPETS
jgi:predicted nucleic acid-binding protein